MRKVLFSLSMLFSLALQAAPASASGGGGCGGPITEGAGASVDISGYCFEPTVLYASPGEMVTWTNQDPTRHDVLGSNGAWGSFEALRQGGTATSTFDRPGVYPYVCTWHPGMSGAIVVGDGGFGRLDIAPVSRVQAGGNSGYPNEHGVAPAGVGVAIMVVALGLVLLLVRGVLRRRAGGPTGS